LLALVDATEMNRLGAQWKTRVELGTTSYINSTFYQPLGYASDFFLAPRVEVSQTPVDVFASSANQRIASYRVRRTRGGLDLGYDVGTVAEIRAGMEWGTAKSTLRTGLPQFPNFDVNTAAFVAGIRVDQLDSVTIPKHGYFADVSFEGERESLGADDTYSRLEATALGAMTFGRLTTVLRGKWGDPLGTTIPFYHQFQLGGLFNLSGYAPNQLLGQSYGLAEAIFLYKLNRGGAILGPLYLGASAEGGNTWSGTPRTFGSLKAAGSVFVASDTLLGPFYFGYGFAGSKHTSFYVLLSRNF
jgi:NTE family protein